MLTVNDLGSQDARETWEDIFNKTYIQPVLEVCNPTLESLLLIIIIILPYLIESRQKYWRRNGSYFE